MRPPFSYVPLLPMLAALMTGVIIGRYVPDGSLVAAPVLLSMALLALFMHRRYAAILMCAVTAGMVIMEVDVYVNRGVMPCDGVHTASGIVLRADEGMVSQRAVISLNNGYRGNCYVTVPFFSPVLKAGDHVEFTGRFTGLESRRDIDGEIDLDGFYFNNHIGGRAVVSHDALRVTGHDGSLWWRVRALRDHVVDAVTCSGLSQDSQAFMCALLVGDDSLMAEDMRPAFARAGLAHILALSGMHVAVIAVLLSWLLLPVSLMGYRRCRWVAVIGMLWLYAVVTGMSPSVVRAVIMFSFVLTAKCMGRHNSSANALCAAAMIILLFTPRQLFAPGFQLSFVAVLALVTLSALLPEMTVRNRVLGWSVDYIVFTLSAFIGTMILAMYYFHQLPLFFLVTNIPCVFVLPFILGGGFVMLIMDAAGIQWNMLDSFVDCLCGMIIGLADRVSTLPGAFLENLYMEWWGVLAGYIAMASFIVAVYYRRVAWSVAGVAGMLVLACSFTPVDGGDTLFLSRTSDATAVILTHGDRGYILSTARNGVSEAEIGNAMNRYSDFFCRRGIDSLSVIDESHAGMNRVIKFGRRNILLVNNGDIDEMPAGHFDYVILGGGFKGDVMQLSDVVECDSILLGTDINGMRRKRYCQELVEGNIAVRNLDTGYGLVLRSE